MAGVRYAPTRDVLRVTFAAGSSVATARADNPHGIVVDLATAVHSDNTYTATVTVPLLGQHWLSAASHRVAAWDGDLGTTMLDCTAIVTDKDGGGASEAQWADGEYDDAALTFQIGGAKRCRLLLCTFSCTSDPTTMTSGAVEIRAHLGRS